MPMKFIYHVLKSSIIVQNILFDMNMIAFINFLSQLMVSKIQNNTIPSSRVIVCEIGDFRMHNNIVSITLFYHHLKRLNLFLLKFFFHKNGTNLDEKI